MLKEQRKEINKWFMYVGDFVVPVWSFEHVVYAFVRNARIRGNYKLETWHAAVLIGFSHCNASFISLEYIQKRQAGSKNKHESPLTFISIFVFLHSNCR